MSFKLPDLPYPHDALAPYMSRETLEYHHDKHHNAYVTTGNKLLEGSGLEGKSLEEIVKGSYGKNQGLFNNAGQHYNHLHFWKWMKPNGGGDKLPGKLQAAIDKDLGGLAKVKEDFQQAGGCGNRCSRSAPTRRSRGSACRRAPAGSRRSASW